MREMKLSLKAFELLGEIAFLSLMEEASVSKALENYVIHIDPEFLKNLINGSGKWDRTTDLGLMSPAL